MIDWSNDELVAFCKQNYACQEGIEFIQDHGGAMREVISSCYNTGYLSWLITKLRKHGLIKATYAKQKDSAYVAFFGSSERIYHVTWLAKEMQAILLRALGDQSEQSD